MILPFPGSAFEEIETVWWIKSPVQLSNTNSDGTKAMELRCAKRKAKFVQQLHRHQIAFLTRFHKEGSCFTLPFETH